MKLSRGGWALVIILLIIIIDQIIKIYVKTHFYLGESVSVASWFKLVFVENNGMAFGMQVVPKIALTLLRVVVIGALCWYIKRIVNCTTVKTGYIICLALVAAGAIGNIIDCLFYGIIFNNPPAPAVAEMFCGGYAPLCYGKVVDMFYFPLFSFDWPGWMPIVGGEHFIFFSPVFNFADAAISVGIIAIILFYSNQISASKAAFPQKVK